VLKIQKGEFVYPDSSHKTAISSRISLAKVSITCFNHTAPPLLAIINGLALMPLIDINSMLAVGRAIKNVRSSPTQFPNRYAKGPVRRVQYGL